MKDHYFVTTCVAARGEDITAMLETAVQVTRGTYVRHTDDGSRRELEVGLGYDRFMPITQDWHVGYFKGVYRGVPAYWLTWSAIEHVFTLGGRT